MAKVFYDIERFIQDMEQVFKDNLNDEIALIDAEKGDYVLPPISDNAWFFRNLNDKIMNYSQFVVFGFDENVKSESAQVDNNIRVAKIFFEVCVTDQTSIIDLKRTHYKLLRYSRALEQVAFKNLGKFPSINQPQVEILFPTEVPIKSDVEPMLINTAGVSITAKFTAN